MSWTSIIALALAFIPFSLLLGSAVGRQIKRNFPDEYSAPVIREVK